MYLNLEILEETLKENIFKIVPITFLIDIKEQKSISNSIRSFTSLFKTFDNISEKIKEISDNYNEKLISELNFENKDIYHKYSLLYFSSGRKGISQYTSYLLPLCHFIGNNYWILKPTSFNRGRGIHVFNNLEKLKELMNSYLNGRKEELNSFNEEKQDTNIVDVKM